MHIFLKIIKINFKFKKKKNTFFVKKMSVTSAINLQMNDFNREIENMDGNFSVFSKVTADILNDLKDGIFNSYFVLSN